MGLPTDHILHYTMDNIVSATLVDETGSYNSVITGALPVAGVIDNALQFNGTSDYTQSSGIVPFDQYSFSISVFFNVDVLSAGDVVFHYGDVTVSGQQGIRAYVDGAGDLYVVYFLGAWSSQIISSAVVAGQDYHLLIRRGASGNLIITLNGTEHINVNIGAISAANQKLTLAATQGATLTGHFNGKIDHFKLFAREVSFAEGIALWEERLGTRSISGTITEAVAGDKFKVYANRYDTGRYIDEIDVDTSIDPTYTMLFSNSEPVILTARVDATKWKEGTYGLTEQVYPTDPVATPYYYKCTTAGTSGSTEPTWPTSAGTVNDGSVVWTFVERLIQPAAQAPLIPQLVV